MVNVVIHGEIWDVSRDRWVPATFEVRRDDVEESGRLLWISGQGEERDAKKKDAEAGIRFTAVSSAELLSAIARVLEGKG